MRHGEVTEGKIDAQGLHILEACPARSGIAVVPDRHRAGQTCQGLLRKNICNKALPLFDIELFAVIRDNAGSFLSAMLQRVKTEIGEVRGFFMAVNTEHGTFVVELIGRNQREFVGHDVRILVLTYCTRDCQSPMVIQCRQFEIDFAASCPLITVYLNHQPSTSDCTDPSGMNTGIPGRI